MIKFIGYSCIFLFGISSATTSIAQKPDWIKLQNDLKELFEYRAMKTSLKSAFLQVKNIKEEKLPKKSLKSFLDEC